MIIGVQVEGGGFGGNDGGEDICVINLNDDEGFYFCLFFTDYPNAINIKTGVTIRAVAQWISLHLIEEFLHLPKPSCSWILLCM